MRLPTLAAKFLRIGATGFGGPMALMGLMQQELVERSAAVSPDDFADGVAVGQMLPGPPAMSCAAYLGFRLHRLAGAAVAAGSLILPAFLLMLVLTPLYLSYGQVPRVAGFFKGVGPVVVAVILAAAWRLGRRFVADAGAVVIGAVVFTLALCRVSPILLVLLAGLLGVLMHGRAGVRGGD